MSDTDHVLFWNDVLLDVFRSRSSGSAAPTRLSRAAAMMYGAVYDAANSARCATASGCLGQPYLTRVPVQAGTAPDPSSAIDHAAYRILTGLYPNDSIDFGAKLAAAQATIPGTVTQAQRDQGAAIGDKTAQVMVVTRANDHSDDTVAYSPGTRPGDWRPTGSGAALDPNWGLVRPFAMDTPNHFRPSHPEGAQDVGELLASPTYRAHLAEVRDVGRFGSTSRSADRTQAAHFWANDLDGTYKPPGQLLQHTAIIARQLPGQDQFANARLFAWMSLALADAAIAAWDAKYRTDIDLWRPETAIHLDSTDPDPSWQPESRRTDGTTFSPPFPAFISGHATFAGAWAGVMKRYVGTDNFAWTATTEDPFAQGVTRSFGTFSDAARENQLSRVWLGVHYRFDGEYSLPTGDRIAEWVTQHLLGTNATLGLDSFARSVTDGFGPADTGGDWWVGDPAVDYAVRGGAGRITLPVAGAGRSAYLNRIRSTDTDLAVKISTDKLATGNGVYVAAVGRKINDAGTYRATVSLRPDGSVRLGLRRTDAAGAETALTTDQTISGLAYQPGSVLRVRLQVTGTAPTTLRAKVWADGTAEPGWQATTSDQTGALQGAGNAGLLANLSGSATNAPIVVTVDDIAIFRVVG
ncbi:vanadium-dependent haloperoxidase [Actinokineospora enzanensis]|uniref:vanadium-dependent haloperoxidase n=1 Tax=Actinokineospora enzanensis TaxID=155975 RepID=UPI00146CFDBA|nr:vanadium-dependent haloperoxidase [Actinokineospora enzanensis]